MLGRGFADGEDREGSTRTMILSHAAWLRQFGGSSSVIGTQVTIDGGPVTIIGVMPRGFEIFGLPADVYAPYQMPPQVPFRGRSLIGLGRLKAGVTRDQAQRDGRRLHTVRASSGFQHRWTSTSSASRAVGGECAALLVLSRRGAVC